MVNGDRSEFGEIANGGLQPWIQRWISNPSGGRLSNWVPEISLSGGSKSLHQTLNGHHNLAMQRKLIVDHVYSKSWGLSDLFCETARTGRLTNRPTLKMMLARAMRGKFDVIVVTSTDRFSRNLMRLLI